MAMKDKEGKLPEIAVCVCGGVGVLQSCSVGFYVRCERDPGDTTPVTFKRRRQAINDWNKRQAQMDNLTRDSVRAYHTGKHYGDYIAMRGHVYRQEEPEEEASEQEPEQIWLLRCVACGELLPEEGSSGRYCNPECAEKFQSMKRSEYHCQVCGNQIPAWSKRWSNCSLECEQKSNRIRARNRDLAQCHALARARDLAGLP